MTQVQCSFEVLHEHKMSLVIPTSGSICVNNTACSQHELLKTLEGKWQIARFKNSSWRREEEIMWIWSLHTCFFLPLKKGWCIVHRCTSSPVQREQIDISVNNRQWWHVVLLNNKQRRKSGPEKRASSHNWVKCSKCTYFFFHLLCDVLHIQSAGWLARLIIFKHRHLFYLC